MSGDGRRRDEVRSTRLRDRLRLETAPLHARIEQNRRLATLAAGTISQSVYRELLAAKLTFYLPVERELAAAVDWDGLEIPLTECLGTPRLVADLLELGVTHKEPAFRRDCHSVPQVANFWQAIGCRYVLAGASLGGQLIARALRSHDSRLPVRFYSGAGEKSGQLWSSFCAVLNSLTPSAEDEQQAVDAARATFVGLTELLDGTCFAAKNNPCLPLRLSSRPSLME